MTTIQSTRIHGIKIGRYGITEKKKAELDAKILEVLDAQHDVDQYQAIVASLTQKLNNFQAMLATADNDRTKALNNKNILDQLVQSTKDLLANSDIAFNDIVLADATTKDLAGSLKEVMDKLIYSVELINKLSALVISKKALNPLISDELVTMIGQAGGDANNAVALTLIALQSTFASQAANMESEAAAALEYTQARSLFHTMTGVDPINSDAIGNTWAPATLAGMIAQAYVDAKHKFEQRQTATDLVTTQLNLANIKLNKAQVNLRSLQSGLGAGNAAALVS
jgi:hypothetical protein